MPKRREIGYPAVFAARELRRMAEQIQIERQPTEPGDTGELWTTDIVKMLRNRARQLTRGTKGRPKP